MLQSPTGATIAAMMKATDWQQHSVRGFLAGVVRKRLKLKLSSKKVDGNRVYQIAGGDGSKAGPRQSKRRAPEHHAARQDRSCTAGPKTVDVEIARLRDLDVARASGSLAYGFRRRPSPHLPRHLLFRVLAYRLQADRFGDLDAESRRLLDGAASPEEAGKRSVDPNRRSPT